MDDGFKVFFGERGDVVLPGFSGLGSFRGRRAREFNRDERTVVEYFFTNPDSNVYGVKDSMPSSLWALLMGQYARSSEPVKERLLRLMRDMPERNPDAKSLSEVAQAIRDSGEVRDTLNEYLGFAEKFISTYGIDYGHASLRDSGTMRMCFEGVTQRSTKYLESAREGAYQEQSTRAIPFSIENLAIPLRIREDEWLKSAIEAHGNDLISFYDGLRRAAFLHLAEKFADLRTEARKKIYDATGSEEGLSDRQWQGIVEAKAFDIARNLLPQNITTSLGITLNVRRFQDQLTEWQSAPLDEMFLLGRAAQIEALKISPELMKYGNPSEFYMRLPARITELRDSLRIGSIGEHRGAEREVSSDLLEYTPNIENLVLASILFSQEDRGNDFNTLIERVGELQPSQKRRIAQVLFRGKKPYEVNPKQTEVGSLTFSRVYDIGGYRDLQRQRGDRQQITPYNPHSGYMMPPEIRDLGENFVEKYKFLMDETENLYDRLGNEGLKSDSEYVPLMGHMINHLTTMDPNQLFYQAKLRAQPAGADSYREIARQEIHQGLEVMPSFKGLIEFDDTPKYPLNRLPESIEGTIRRIISRNK